MVKFRELVNPLILDAEWVGFSGNSEYKREDGEYAMGYWNFLGIAEDEATDDDWSLDDEIDDSILYEDKWLFRIVNGKGNVCIVKFIYHKE